MRNLTQGAFGPMKKLPAITSLAVVLGVLLFPPAALGQEAPTAAARFADQMFEIVTPIFVTVISTLASWVLWKARQRFGFQISESTQQQWDNIAEKAALRGAEWARQQAKTTGRKVKGPAVLEVAANWAIDIAKDTKLPARGRDVVNGLVEAQLYKLRQQMGSKKI